MCGLKQILTRLLPGVQPHFWCSYALDREWTHQAGRTVAIHGQVSGNWRQGWNGKGMGSLRQETCFNNTLDVNNVSIRKCGIECNGMLVANLYNGSTIPYNYEHL